MRDITQDWKKKVIHIPLKPISETADIMIPMVKPNYRTLADILSEQADRFHPSKTRPVVRRPTR